MVHTQNRYDVLQDSFSDEDTEPKQDKAEVQTSDNIHLVIDSHGNGIDPKKMYKNKDFKMTILRKGENNIKGAQSFCSSNSLPKHLIIGVGNNDLDKKKDTDMCIREMTHLLHSISRRSENCNIHVLPAFERVNQHAFSDKVYHLSSEIEKVCDNYSNCEFIKNLLISSSDQTLFLR